MNTNLINFYLAYVSEVGFITNKIISVISITLKHDKINFRCAEKFGKVTLKNISLGCFLKLKFKLWTDHWRLATLKVPLSVL